MVYGMVKVPAVIGSEGKASQYGAYDFVGMPGGEKGAVSAVMKDDEHPDHESRSRDCKSQGNPVRDIKGEVHKVPNHYIGTKRVDDLPDAFFNIRLIIPAYNVYPGKIFSVGHGLQYLIKLIFNGLPKRTLNVIGMLLIFTALPGETIFCLPGE